MDSFLKKWKFPLIALFKICSVPLNCLRFLALQATEISVFSISRSLLQKTEKVPEHTNLI